MNRPNRNSKSADVRTRLSHPVIDMDAHLVEFVPAFLDYLKEVGGSRMVERYQAIADIAYEYTTDGSAWYKLTPEQRRFYRATRTTWWALPTHDTLNRATSTLPRLLYERLDEFGIDFMVLFTSLGLGFSNITDDELRQACARAMNNFYADIFSEVADRMTPAAIIPMHTPEEAISELEHAVRVKGLKVVMMAGHVRRPLPVMLRDFPQAARYTYWIDNLCLDSEYDYDPVWAKCLELKVAPTFQGISAGIGTRRSISNFVFNHLGMFASAGEVICKALFLGGVTRRFPGLRFAFLEGGVAWACSLYNDLVSHWEKRNLSTLKSTYDPAQVDVDQFVKLCRDYGGRMMTSGKGADLTELLKNTLYLASMPEEESMLDEFAPCGIRRAEDVRDLFVPKFFFGCEADDAMNCCAFDSRRNRLGARLNAVFSSDIGHWDVPDLGSVLAEAYELVEKGLLTEEDFCDFTFTNGLRMLTDVNPDFFKGTVLDRHAGRLTRPEKPQSGQTAGRP